MTFRENIGNEQNGIEEFHVEVEPAQVRAKKIPPELRKSRINYYSEPNVIKRFFWRLKED